MPGLIAWLQPNALGSSALHTLEATLEPDEQARAAVFEFDEDRRSFVAAHGLLRLALSHGRVLRPNAWRLVYDATGKPIALGAGPVAFSLSHTRTLVACAVATAGPIGLDVVEVDETQPDKRLIACSCAAAESARIAGMPEDRRAVAFARLWALKEAAAKALGTGDGFSPALLEFSPDERLIANAHVSDGRARACTFTTLLPTPRHIIAVARPRGTAEFAIRTVDDDGVTFAPTARDG